VFAGYLLIIQPRASVLTSPILTLFDLTYLSKALFASAVTFWGPRGWTSVHEWMEKGVEQHHSAPSRLICHHCIILGQESVQSFAPLNCVRYFLIIGFFIYFEYQTLIRYWKYFFNVLKIFFLSVACLFILLMVPSSEHVS
jgi:hypothetical protein